MPRYGLDSVSVSYQNARVKTQVFGGLTLEISPGEMVVVLGETGAGKSTLLRVLAGLQKTDSGRVLEDGQDISTLPPHRRDMAMVFQNFSLYPRMTVAENLAFPLQAKVLNLPPHEIEKRVRESADFLGLTDKLSRRPDQLSGGELQRVAIGRALVRRPKLFLMDEPLASLDAKLRERMVIEIHRMQRSLGCGMIYVTHDHEEAMSLADRILVLHHGRILQSGTPEEIYRHPESKAVARMLGRPGINILNADEAGRLGLPDKGKKWVGIRPESWKVTADANGPATATVVEHLGPLIAMVLDVQGITLRVSVPPGNRVKLGDRFRLGIDPEALNYFDQ